jgi:uncharacterized membrane protein YhhN
MTGVLALAALLDPLGSGALANYMVAFLASLGLTVLSIGATWLFVFTGGRPQRAYYVVAIACFVLSHWVFLGHSLEWWRGAMLEAPVNGQIFGVLPLLSAMALVFIGGAPHLRRQRDQSERI